MPCISTARMVETCLGGKTKQAKIDRDGEQISTDHLQGLVSVPQSWVPVAFEGFGHVFARSFSESEFEGCCLFSIMARKCVSRESSTLSTIESGGATSILVLIQKQRSRNVRLPREGKEAGMSRQLLAATTSTRHGKDWRSDVGGKWSLPISRCSLQDGSGDTKPWPAV
jgi:hypothetical protein